MNVELLKNVNLDALPPYIKQHFKTVMERFFENYAKSTLS